jgi:hypothetical protein
MVSTGHHWTVSRNIRKPRMTTQACLRSTRRPRVQYIHTTSLQPIGAHHPLAHVFVLAYMLRVLNAEKEKEKEKNRLNTGAGRPYIDEPAASDLTVSVSSIPQPFATRTRIQWARIYKPPTSIVSIHSITLLRPASWAFNSSIRFSLLSAASCCVIPWTDLKTEFIRSIAFAITSPLRVDM